jgi:hypothetical protein
MRFEIGEPPPGDRGVSCSIGREEPRGTFASRVYEPYPAVGRAIAYGELSKRVARLKFHLSTGKVISGKVMDAPDDGYSVSYYMEFLPLTDDGEILALGPQGTLLGSARL